MGEHEERAALYIALFDSFAHRMEELNCKRYNKEFLNVFSDVKDETAPIMLMFMAFIGGLDMGVEIIETLERMPTEENAPTEER